MAPAPTPRASILAALRAVSPLGWVGAAFAALALLLFGWLVMVAPPWRIGTLAQPPVLVLLAADGSELARKGPRPFEPVDVDALPPVVRNAFLAIEDRRFYRHGALDPRGLARALATNWHAGHVVQGGSTLTQQLAKNAYLSNDRTWARKLREALLAGWLEMWMTKDAIFGRYLQTVYFGDNCYGLPQAARHYFGRRPDQLTLGQAAMLAGLVKAPTRLSPSNDRPAAAARMHIVLGAMVDAGFLSASRAAHVRAPRLVPDRSVSVNQSGGWFGDWVMAQLPQGATGTFRTTLDPQLQARAEAVAAAAPLGGSEIAMLAMRPDGSVVAMVGGRDYAPGAFNRATRAARQPGSTFKLFDYIAAFRAGFGPDSTVVDAPLQIGDWQPTNAYAGYYGPLSFRDAFARSSNLAAVRVAEAAGRANVIRAARDLGVTAPLPQGPSLALGVASVRLTELAGAYAAVMAGRYPVVAHGLALANTPPRLLDAAREREPMLDLLWHAANEGTGRAAAIETRTYGKTGTTQDSRDALFVGFAGNLLVAVWIGRDDNAPIPGASGGHLPAQIWHAFMNGIPLGPLPDPGRLAPVPPLTPGQLAPWSAPRRPEPSYEPDAQDEAPPTDAPDSDQPDSGEPDSGQPAPDRSDPSGRNPQDNGGELPPPDAAAPPTGPVGAISRPAPAAA